MGCTQLYQRGKIASLDGHTAHIVFEPLGSCAACAGGCGLASIASLLGAGRRGALRVDVETRVELTVGDRVRVGIDARRLLQLVVATYFTPLIGMVAGAVAVTTMTPVTGDVGALSGAVAGGLLVGWALFASAGRRRSLDWLGARVTGLA
jgi:positive regulator of sigma E activity